MVKGDVSYAGENYHGGVFRGGRFMEGEEDKNIEGGVKLKQNKLCACRLSKGCISNI